MKLADLEPELTVYAFYGGGHQRARGTIVEVLAAGSARPKVLVRLEEKTFIGNDCVDEGHTVMFDPSELSPTR